MRGRERQWERCGDRGAARYGLQRVDGIFGNAMGFSGRHMLRVPGKPTFEKLQKVSLSAWVRPTGFERYNEIFRKEDGSERVLFSFQENMTILSLGLNVGGYVECDAKIKPEQVLDGRWHHCAATFEGEWMRVYLDGREIGSLQRKGVITAGGNAPGCLGSANGAECFQGAMDDLRIYKDALTADEVTRLHRNGLDALAKLAEPVAAAEPKLDKSLLAHWTFNERGGVLNDASGNPTLRIQAGNAARARGVHGRALKLQGTHSLQTKAGRAPLTSPPAPGTIAPSREP